MSNLSPMRDPRHELLFGALVLAGPTGDASAAFSLHVQSENTDWGNPAPVRTIIDSLLGDGQLVSIERDDNREAAVGIQIRGNDSGALARAEAELVAQTRRRNVLSWTPPDGLAPITVFDVVTSWLEHVFDGQDEMRLVRRYVLHLELYPHARSRSTTLVEALGSGTDPTEAPVYELVTDADSLAGWTGRTGAGIDPITMNSGHVYLRGDIGWDLWVQFDTGAVQDWSDTPYVVVDWTASGSDDPDTSLQVFATGPGHTDSKLTRVSVGPSPFGGNWRRSVFSLDEHATTTRRLKFHKINDLTSGSRWALWLNKVQVTDGGAANDGTARELSRSLEVRGSARAMGTINVRHANVLGDVLVWSGPAACAPPLRKLRVSGAGEVGDTTAVSGAYEDIGVTAFTADVPIATLPPGAYAVVARLSSTSGSGTKTVDVTARTRLADSEATTMAVGSTATIDAARVTLGLDPDRRIVNLGVLHLPTTEVGSGSGGVIRITLQGTDVRLDEAWLFNITDGDLTLLQGADKVVRITPATLEDPRPRVWTGPSDSALYDAGASVSWWGQHVFNPGDWAAFTVTTTAEDAAVEVEYFKRWHTHAAEDG